MTSVTGLSPQYEKCSVDDTTDPYTPLSVAFPGHTPEVQYMDAPSSSNSLHLLPDGTLKLLATDQSTYSLVLDQENVDDMTLLPSNHCTLNIQEKIGEGNFGTVYLGSFRGAAVAFKQSNLIK